MDTAPPSAPPSADEIRELAAHIHAAHARLAVMLAEFTADGHWNASGEWRSLAHWLGLNCGLARSEAVTLQRVVQTVDVMPDVMAQAQRGVVSLQVTSQIARVATPDNQATLAGVAASATPSQVNRILADHRAVAPPPIPTPFPSPSPSPSSTDPSDDDRSYWRTWFDDLGMWHVSGQAPAHVGALVDEAFRAARASSARADGAGATDAIRALADLTLDAARHDRLRDAGGEHFAVTVLVDITTLHQGVLGVDSICRLECGPDLAPGLVRELAEQGTVQLLWEQHGVPLKMGLTARFATREQRRALRRRDGGCSVPGCDAKRHLHAHHVLEYPVGPTDLDNLVLLCGFHHRLVHRRVLAITPLGQQRFDFRDRNGRPIGPLLTPLPTDGSGPPADLRHLPEHRSLAIDQHTAGPRGDRLTEWGRDVLLHALLTAGDDRSGAAVPEFATAV